jgi:hypothetical protein
MMAGFQLYNSAGALTIDSENKSVVMSTVKAMGTLEVMEIQELLVILVMVVRWVHYHIRFSPKVG